MSETDDLKTYRINEVEIFSAGEWNKDKYDITDLHAMVQAFNNLKDGFKPYLKLGHDNKQQLAKSSGLPSVGWVERIYVKGSKLFADLDYIPQKIYKLIKSKAYRKVSCEVYWDLDVDGTKYPRVLGAVALLGAETPGVMNLRDILGTYSNKNKTDVVFKAFEKDDKFRTYEVDFHTNEGSEMEELEGLKAELEASKKEYSTVEAAKADLQKQLDSNAEELKALREANMKAIEEANAAKVAKFVTEMESKKLVTPGMKDLITQLVSDKKEFSVGEKTLSKEEAIEQILVLSQEAAKVNFDESSRADFAKKEDKMKDLEDKIEKYSKDNKCSYAQAYKAVMKDVKQEVEE
jgi:hypothetical protein